MRVWFGAFCFLTVSCTAHGFPPTPKEPPTKSTNLAPRDEDVVGIKMSALFAKWGEPDSVVSTAHISTFYPNMTALVVFVYNKHKKHVFIDRSGKVEAVSNIVK